MAENSNKFAKGMNSDVHPAGQIPETYRYGLNFTHLSEDGNIYALVNESGTKLLDSVSFPGTMKPVGYTVLNNDIIVALCDEQGNSQLGYIREDSSDLDPDYGFYHPSAPIAADGTFPIDNKEFNWSIERPIDMVARKVINGSRVVYYTDNFNPFGRVELEDAPEVGEVLAQTRLVFDQELPVFSLTEIVEDVAGSLRPGVYQFITRYITDNGGVTTFGLPSDQISIVPTPKSQGVNGYAGAYYEDTEVNKNILLEISNIDQNYQELEIVVCYYDQGTTFQARSIARLPITSDTVSFTFSTVETGEETALTRAEIRQVPIAYKRAKCIEQKNNRLFLSNLSDDTIDNEALQKAANNITVKYEVKELKYSGREGEPITSSNGNLFSFTSIEYRSPNSVAVKFSGDLFNSFTFSDSSSFNSIIRNLGTVTYGGLNHSLTTNGAPSTALIDVTGVQNGDTVEFNGNVYTATTNSADTNPNSFFITGDVNSNVESLNLVINTIETSNEYAAIPKEDGGVNKTFIITDFSNEGDAITYTGNLSGDATVSGGNNTPSLIYASNVELTGDGEITYTFDSAGLQITQNDVLTSTDIQNSLLSDDTSPTGTVSLGVNLNQSSSSDPSEESFTDHLDEKVLYDSRSYRRGEVYSLGYALIFKDGSSSFVYHIPAPATSSADTGKFYPSVGNYNTGNSSGVLGTFVSDREYPLEQFYPGDEPDDDPDTAGFAGIERNVRHHVIPNLTQEPHFIDRGGSSANVRTIGLRFEFDPSNFIPDAILKDVQEIVFVRERRNSDANKSVLAQGLINRLVETADHCDNSGVIDGTTQENVRSSYCLQEMPFFNNVARMNVSGDSKQRSSGHSFRGICWPGAIASENTLSGSRTFENGKKLNTDVRGNRAFFHSPETLLAADTGFSAAELNGAEMKPWLLLEGEAFTTLSTPNKFKGDGQFDTTEGYAYHDMHGNYTGYNTSFVYDDLNNRVIRDAENRPGGIRRNSAIGTDTNRPVKTTTRWTQGGLEVFVINDNATSSYDNDTTDWSFNSEHEFIDANTVDLFIDHRVSARNKAATCLNDCTGTNFGGEIKREVGGSTIPSGQKIDIKNHLYNIEIDNPTQYGELATAQFIPIGRKEVLSQSGNPIFNFSGIFNGDTFITKFSFNTGGLIWYYPYDRNADASINKPFETESRRSVAYQHITPGPEGRDQFKAEGYDLRACHYYFVESDINTYYRHRPEDEERQNYFPNEPSPKENLENFYAYFGNIRAYNGLYSFENNLREFYIRGSVSAEVSSFENRTIYSEEARDNAVVDSYRSFLVNNYNDLPANTGPIWDSFVHATTLYLHTTKSCWRTFAEPAATIAGGNISEVVLGTGSLFARPSIEVLTTDGGYGGTISQFGGVHSQLGYIFPDVLQGKVFLLGVTKNGPQLQDMSQAGMYTFLHKNMPLGLIKFGEAFDLANVTTDNANLIDNPYNGIGFTGGYDYKQRRAWIVKQGEQGFTMSYSALMNSWTSFHSYQPDVLIPYDNRVFFIKDGVTWEMNTGLKGEFFGTVYPTQLDISVATGVSVAFMNQIVAAEITDKDGLKTPNDFFSTYQVTSNKQNTTEQNFIEGNSFAPSKAVNETFFKFRNDNYNIAVPRDAVVDNSQSLFDLNNIWETYGGTVTITNNGEDYVIRERIKGQYAEFKYTYDNLDNGVAKDSTFVLREIRTIFEQNIR
jgi:hypothetical protein